MALSSTSQRCLCPEAEFWSIGDVVVIGKGSRSSLFVVVGRLSPVSVLVKFKRDLQDS